MPDVDWNTQTWARDYDWSAEGDEWSAEWGGAQMQWFGTLLPRISSFVPAETVLEIAPGYGRWTQFLRGLCGRLVGVDLSERCIESCRERFAGDDRAEFHVNDGRSLPTVADGSVDFAFSFDSLVHVELDVLAAYAGELTRVLKPGGAAFLHHSNLGEHAAYFDRVNGLPRGRRFLRRMGWIETYDHHRGRSVTADKFRAAAAEAGLACPSQEIINWGSTRTIDCLTVLTRPGSPWDRPTRVLRNPDFMRQAHHGAKLAELYTRSTFADGPRGTDGQ